MSHSLRIRIPPPILEDEFRTPVPSKYGQAEEEEGKGKGKEGSQRGLQQPSCAIDGSTSNHTTSERNEQEKIDESYSSLSTITCSLYKQSIASSESKKELEILQKKGGTMLSRLIRYIGC